eukprot:jgi/Hompol1/5507/HPOL_001952-RA
MSQVNSLHVHEDFEMQDKARELIPVDELHSEAHSLLEANPGSHFDDHLMRGLLRWFKGTFFKWVNCLDCSTCGRANTYSAGTAQPTPEDIRFGAHVVEIHKCRDCGGVTRFPRYNDLSKLLETRRGRCGEWANVFYLICRTMGYDTRYIMDFTDHVWTEIYHPTKHRWIHCDSCEGESAFDTPLLYEAGWGKHLTYVIAVSPHQVLDVTKRYTAKWSQLQRDLVDESWIVRTLSSMTMNLRINLPQSLKDELAARDLEELRDLGSNPSQTSASALPARESGHADWKAARGENGPSK